MWRDFNALESFFSLKLCNCIYFFFYCKQIEISSASNVSTRAISRCESARTHLHVESNENTHSITYFARQVVVVQFCRLQWPQKHKQNWNRVNLSINHNFLLVSLIFLLHRTAHRSIFTVPYLLSFLAIFVLN